MVHIHSVEKFDEYTGPGLYYFYNVDAGTVLDNGGVVKHMACGQNLEDNNDNQKWLVAATSANKVIFICRRDCQVLTATGEREQIKTTAIEPEALASQWYIEHGDGNHKKLYIKSVKYPGRVLELRGGEEADQTPVFVERRNGDVEGQLWVVKRIGTI